MCACVGLFFKEFLVCSQLVGLGQSGSYTSQYFPRESLSVTIPAVFAPSHRNGRISTQNKHRMKASRYVLLLQLIDDGKLLVESVDALSFKVSQVIPRDAFTLN